MIVLCPHDGTPLQREVASVDYMCQQGHKFVTIIYDDFTELRERTETLALSAPRHELGSGKERDEQSK